MSNEVATSGYLLLFRGTDWDHGLSPEEMQRVLQSWDEWLVGLQGAGKLRSAAPLRDEGRIVSGKNGRTVADGPFAESKEAVGGYFFVDVASLEEATEIAQRCPALEHGMQVEVRPIATMCGIAQRAGHTCAAAVR